ncbi:MAG TPA: hypothetical protein VIB47_00195 [Dehalococcoidia bacterium]
MTTALTDTQRKLEHVPERLLDEFEDLPREPVQREVQGVAGQLLRQARFPDFVPVLTHRFVREHLLDLAARRTTRRPTGAS